MDVNYVNISCTQYEGFLWDFFYIASFTKFYLWKQSVQIFEAYKHIYFLSVPLQFSLAW